MAAQAVDFTLSGQVGRTLFVNDSDTSTNPMSIGSDGEIRDNNGATRFRLNGSSELDDGSRIGIQFEMGVNAGVLLRHANVQYTSSAGRITVGQGSEAGDGSAGVGVGVTGIGAGQDGTKDTFEMLTSGPNAGTNIGLGSYFGSLDGGTRTNMIRYDTPAIGPVSAAVSVGNGDRVSGLLALSTEAGGSTFAARLGAYRMGDETSISGSAGVTLPSGLAVAGAWGRGDDVAIMGTAMAAMAAVPVQREFLKNPAPGPQADAPTATSLAARTTDAARMADVAPWFNSDPGNMDDVATTDGNWGTFDNELGEIAPMMPAQGADMEVPVLSLANLDSRLNMAPGMRGALTPAQLAAVQRLISSNACARQPVAPVAGGAPADGAVDTGDCELVPFAPARAAVAAVLDRRTDPSYVMARVGYTFGNTTVAASWYSSEDFIWTGAEGTAIGFGASHALPKVGATIHAAVQNYEVDFPDGRSQKETVFQLGTLVTF